MSGDVNDNGVVNILDVVALVNIILGEGGEVTQENVNGDMNGDGNINVLDIVRLVNLALLDP